MTAAEVAAGRVALLGMMGAGKTTTGTTLARDLGWAFHDSDAQIEARTGDSAATLAVREGVEALHDLEARILLDALAIDEPVVVAAAASVVDSHRCREALRRFQLVVWLDAPLGVLARRAAGGAHRRAMDPAAAEAALATRRERFAEVADLRLEATVPTDDLVTQIVRTLAARSAS